MPAVLQLFLDSAENVHLCSADRNQGVEYANDLADSCRQVRTYVTNLETEMKERTALIEMLEQSELYYDAQASEANTVAMVSVLLSLLMFLFAS